LGFGVCDMVVSYEQLRSEVLGEERIVRQSLGWSHLVRHGMAAWLEVCAQELPEPAIIESQHIAEDVLPCPHNEIVSVMAGMALGCLVEVV
jgi:hypothetical protein